MKSEGSNCAHLASPFAPNPPGQVSLSRAVMSSPISVLCSLGEKYLGVIFPAPLRVALASRPLWGFFPLLFLFVRFEEKVNR